MYSGVFCGSDKNDVGFAVAGMRAALLFSAVCASVAVAAPTQIAAPITEVTLYPGSARIVRVAHIKQGFSEVVVGHLPAGFDTDTLEVTAGQDAQIGQIVTRSHEQAEAVNPNVAGVLAAIRVLQDKIARLDARIKAETMVQRYLGDIGSAEQPATAGKGKAVAAADIARTAQTIRQQANSSLSAAQQLHEQKRTLDDELAARQRELGRLQAAATGTRTVAITVNAGSAQSLTLSYQVPNAGWKPAYRADLLSQQSVVAISRLATVSQKTGEDWKDVRLKLSSNRPDSRFAVPNPPEWQLHYYPPAPPQEGREGQPPLAKMMAQPRFAPAPRALSATAEAAVAGGGYIPPVFETHQAYSTVFSVPYTVSLPSDGREMSLTLSSLRLPVQQKLLIAPRREKRAAIMAVAERPQGVWLPGEIQLFRDGSYVGKRMWRPNTTDTANAPQKAAGKQLGEGMQGLRFAFGQDDLVRVQSIRQQENAEKTGVFNRKRRKLRSYRYEVHNTHPFAVDVEVVEAGPVSSNSEVQVQSRYEPEPTLTRWRGKRGVVAWQQRIEANSSGSFSAHHTVDYPQEGRLQGM